MVKSTRRTAQEDNDDDLFAQLEAELEDDDTTARERDEGIQEMMRYMERRKQMQGDGHGQYTLMKDDAEVLQMTVKEPLSVVHFFHTRFKRCEIMDGHLEKLSKKYFNTRFVRVLAETAPFLVEKLGVKVLPCVICFKQGVTCGRVIGFEDFGSRDDFPTSALVAKLMLFGVIKNEEEYTPSVTYGANSTVREHIRQHIPTEDEDFDFDL